MGELSPARASRELHRILLYEAAGTVLLTGLAALLLRWVSEVALRPLGQMRVVANRTAAGHRGERLRPERTDTEVGRLAEAYDEMLDALETSLAEAHRSEALARRFLDDAAHQLRTPITGIRACAETMLAGVSPSDSERLLVNLQGETVRAGRLIGSLLNLARPGEGQRPKPAFVPCDVVRLCVDEAARVVVHRPAPNVYVRTAESFPDGARHELEPDALRETLANLLDNARRHAVSRIDVVVDSGDGYLEVRVVDDGPGMSDAMAARCFERFVSLDRKGGTGLGLPIARGLTRAHGGDLRYEHGAFVIHLPARTETRERPDQPELVSSSRT